MLKTRIMTAMILISIILLVLFYLPAAPFCLLTAFIILAGAWEWTGLMTMKTIGWRSAYVFLVAFLLFFALFVPAPLVLLISAIWWVISLPLVIFYPKTTHWFASNKFIRGLMGLLVLVPAWTAVNFIRAQNDGVFALLFLFILVWGADSAAYFVGKKWGTTKLLPLVSPGKSVQGLIGALVFSVLVTLGLLVGFQTPLVLWQWAVLLTLVTTVFSVVGDLFESVLKRQAGVKDSGNLLPGHGGVLDRIDSLTAAAPVFAVTAWILRTYLY